MQIMSGNTKCKVAYFSGGSRLPAEFQEVEYIESRVNGPYINTLVPGTQRLNMVEESDIEFTQVSNSLQFQGWGAYNRSHYGITGNGLYTLEGNVVSNTNAIGVRRKLTATYLATTMELNIGGIETIIRTGSDIAPTPGGYYYLMGNITSNSCRAKLYSSKFYQNGTTLIRDFVPCYRKADNVAGLYDLVNGVFYTNAGTGTFIVGNDVSSLVAIKCQVH